MSPNHAFLRRLADAGLEYDPAADTPVSDESTLADAAAIGVAVSLLPDDHELVVAVRLGLEVRGGRRELREAGLDVHRAYLETADRQREGGTRNVVQPGVGRERLGLPGEWGVTHQVLEQRRAQPGRLATEGAA